MTPAISALATAVPAYQFSLADAKRCLAAVMPLSAERLALAASVFDHAGVERRFSAYPLEYLVRPRPLGQVSREYRERAIELGRRVAAAALERAGLESDQIDLLITVSCTGVMLPSLDAYLVNDLGFRRDVRRLPVTELGCAAGAAALAWARDFLLASPSARVLAISVEFPSLTFQVQDVSMANLVSCAVFGDGAAAAVITGADAPGIRILDRLSHLFPDSYDALGFDLADGGLHIVLGKQIAGLIRSGLREAVERLLGRHGLRLSDLGFVVLHPGGKKLIEAAEQGLGLTRAQTQPSWDVLRDYGNLSSASVFFVLERLLAESPPRPGERGLMVAFGPGFSAELLLAAVGAGRLIELRISRRHQAALARDGVRMEAEPAFRWIVLLHTGVLAGSAAEAVLLRRRLRPALAAGAAIAVLLATGLRWWTISTLGRHWNVHIADSLRLGVVTGGPYRWLRHPNYLALIVEMAALPLIHSAWLTALAGGVGHALLLRRRIAAEEVVLMRSPAYRAAMGGRPRLLPRIGGTLTPTLSNALTNPLPEGEGI